MTPDEARGVLKEALLHVDFINLGRSVSALGEYNYTWRTFDKSKWQPNKHLALRDAEWLESNGEQLANALRTLKQTRG